MPRGTRRSKRRRRVATTMCLETPLDFPLPSMTKMASSTRTLGCQTTLSRISLLTLCLVGLIGCLTDQVDTADAGTAHISGYTHYDELTSLLNHYVQVFPTLAKLHDVGRSVQNRSLWALQITADVSSANVNPDTTSVNDRGVVIKAGRPMFKYVGNMHGNEPLGRQLLVYLVEYLLTNYGSNDRVTKLVDSVNIFIMPSVNPDGFEKSREGDCDGIEGRGNANDIDLNRNFPDQFNQAGSEQALEPETRVMMDWISHTPFVLSANLHGGSLVASYPFDDSRSHGVNVDSRSPDDALFQHVAHVYANAHPTMHIGAECPGDNFTAQHGITNGAQWYDVAGGMQDWNYLHSNCFEITLELSCCKYPPHRQLKAEWAKNREALLQYLDQVNTGVKGQVRDTQGRAVVNATVRVEGNEKTVATVTFGDYWRLLLPGTYTISVSKTGSTLAIEIPTLPGLLCILDNYTLRLQVRFITQTQHVTVTERQVVILNFTLSTASDKAGSKDAEGLPIVHEGHAGEEPVLTATKAALSTTNPPTVSKTRSTKVPTITTKEGNLHLENTKEVVTQPQQLTVTSARAVTLNSRPPLAVTGPNDAEGIPVVNKDNTAKKETGATAKNATPKTTDRRNVTKGHGMNGPEITVTKKGNLSPENAIGSTTAWSTSLPVEVDLSHPQQTLVAMATLLGDAEHRDKIRFREPNLMRHLSDDELAMTLQSLHSRFPRITRLYSVGKSVQGRDLWTMEVSDHPGLHEPGEPEFKYIGNMHGNEVVGRVLLVNLIQLLCENYADKLLVSLLVNTTRIHIMPSMNPDGYATAIEGERLGLRGRTNAHNRDLNRNFPDQYFTNNDNQHQEPETRSVMAWMRAYPFVLSANIHGGSLVANYPYDDTARGHREYSKSPDDVTFKVLSEAYSMAHPTMHRGHPCERTSPDNFRDGITNGAEWYNVAGGMQDWNYLHTNCFEITLEVGCYKYPYERDLPEFWDANEYPLLVFMAQVHKGVRGFVKTSSGVGIANATIQVEGIQHDLQTASNGDYWRLLAPGSYTITVIMGGYESVSQTVVVTAGAAAVANFTLKDVGPQHWSEMADFGITENMNGDAYLTAEQVEGELQKLAQENPDIAAFTVIGHSSKGAPIVGVDVTDDVKNMASDLMRLHVLLVGRLNGDEPLGTELLVRLARHLVIGHKKGSGRVNTILKNTVIHIVPLFARDSISIATPGDCNGGMYGGPHYDDKFSTEQEESPEVMALRSFFETKNVQLVLSVEAGGMFVRFPLNKMRRNDLGQKVGRTEADSAFITVGSAYVDAHESISHGGVCGERDPHGLVHGVEWHTHRGSLMDYLFFKHGTLMLAAHISCCKFPKPAVIPQLWRDNLEPLTALIERGQQGAFGMVKGPDGTVIKEATVTALGQRVSVSPAGSYRLILTAGNHPIAISAPGFDSLSKLVMVKPDEAQMADFSLRPEVESLKYHNFTMLEAEVHALTNTYPKISRIYSLGKSVQGRDLWVLELHTAPGKHMTSHSEVRLMAGVHGNERVGPELLLQFAHTLCKNYGGDYTITQLLDTVRIHMLLMANPDGVSVPMGDGNCANEKGLLNANGVNLDTNFSEGSRPSDPLVQPEVKAIMEWTHSAPFVLSVVLRSGALLVTYPYSHGGGNHRTPDDSILRQLASVYASEHSRMRDSAAICDDNGDTQSHIKRGTLNAAMFKRRSSSMQDWVYNTIGCLELTVYTGCCMFPQPNVLAMIWRENHPALLRLLQQAQRGLTGVVTDSFNRPLVKVKISIDGLIRDSWTGPEGDFWRPLLPGTYNVTAKAKGFKAQTHVVPAIFNSRRTNCPNEGKLPRWNMDHPSTVPREIKIDEKNMLVKISFHLHKEQTMFNMTSTGVIAIVVVALLVLLVTVGVIVCIRCVGTKKTGPAFHRLHSDDYFEDNYLNTPLGSKLLFNREYRDDYDEEEDGDMSNGFTGGSRNLLTNEYHDATSDEEFTLPPGRGIKE